MMVIIVCKNFVLTTIISITVTPEIAINFRKVLNLTKHFNHLFISYYCLLF